MKLHVIVAITTVLFVALSLFEGTESRSIASAARIGSSREKRAATFKLDRRQASLGSIDDFPSEARDLWLKAFVIGDDTMIEDNTTTEKQTLGTEKRSWDNYEMDEPEYDDLQDMKDEDTTENSDDVQEAEDTEKGSWDNYDVIEPLWPTSTDGIEKEDSEKECDECEEKENNGIAGFYDDD